MNESKLKINTITRIVIPKVINLFLIGILVFEETFPVLNVIVLGFKKGCKLLEITL